MPGTVIDTGTIAGATGASRAASSRYFVVGQAERGPTSGPVLCRSFADFVKVFGASTPYSTLWDDVRMFFAEKGSHAQVLRVAGPGATVGALSTALQDRATTPGNSLSVAAASPGAWSSRVSVQVLDGPTAASFRIQVLLDGKIVEDYAALTSPAQAVSQINSGARASGYIRVTDAGSVAAAPANNPKAIASPVTLTAGNDDRASVTAATYTAALDRFDDSMGDGAVAVPGMGSAVHAALLAHAALRNRIAILTSERGSDKATLLGQAAAQDNPRGGLFAPWVQIPDASGGTKVVSPDGYVAAARARAHDTVGPWRAGAGELSRAEFVVAPDQVFGQVDGDDLDNGKVNAIRTIAASTRVYGWRSLSNDPANYRMISAADVVNRVVTACKLALEPYVFAAVDGKGQLLSAMAGTLEGVVAPMAVAGGLFPLTTVRNGQTVVVDPGYKVDTGPSLNTTTSLSADQIRGTVGVRPAPTAALVLLTVNKASVTAAL
jgi:hypothetical protein